jgi:hypothetical protein
VLGAKDFKPSGKNSSCAVQADSNSSWKTSDAREPSSKKDRRIQDGDGREQRPGRAAPDAGEMSNGSCCACLSQREEQERGPEIPTA